MAQRAIIEKYQDGNVVISNLRNNLGVSIFGANETITATLVSKYYDGSEMNDSKVDGKIYIKLKALPSGADASMQQYIGKYFLVNLPNWGETFLEKDTMQQMREMSFTEILLLKARYYKGVTLNGYDSEGSTPTPIQYFLSTTSSSDDGGSVIAVEDIKLEHKFNVIYPEYFGAKGDGIADDTDALERSFIKLKDVRKLKLTRKYRKTRQLTYNGLVSGGQTPIDIDQLGESEIISDNCNGVKISGVRKGKIKLLTSLINSPNAEHFGFEVSGTSIEIDYMGRIADSVSNWKEGIHTIDFNECSIFYEVRGRGATMNTADKKGIGHRLGYGINNTFLGCKTLYTEYGLLSSLQGSPEGHSNEGALFIGCHYLGAKYGVWLNPVTFVSMESCVIDIIDKHALYLNGVQRSTFNQIWMGVRNEVPGYESETSEAVIVTSSKIVNLNNVVMGTPRAEGFMVQDSDRVNITNLTNNSVAGTPFTLRLKTSVTNSQINGRLVNINLANQSASTLVPNYSSSNYNQFLLSGSIGTAKDPAVVLQNKYGSRIASLLGETTNVLEVFGDSSSSTANNFQLGKIAKGLAVRYSGISGWQERIIQTLPSDFIKRGTTAQRPVGLNASSDIGYPYFDTTLGKFIFWDGGVWIENIVTSATTTVKGVVNQSAYSADTATVASGATPTKAEFDALFNEFRDFKNKDRASGQSATS